MNNMNPIKRFANMFSEYSAFYIAEAGAAVNTIDLLIHRQYYSALSVFSIGISTDVLRRIFKKYENKEHWKIDYNHLFILAST